MGEITARPSASTGMAVLKRMLSTESVQAQFANALKENKDLFTASIIDLYNSDAQLQQCAPAAVISEALKAAVLRLPLSRFLGFAYIVTYNNNVRQPDGTWRKVPTPTFVPGYKGYIQLAMRTGQYKCINADVLYEGEYIACNKLTGEIDLSGERKSDKVVGYFAYFELLNGFRKTLYMSVSQMAQYAKRFSKSVPQNMSVADLEALAQSNTPQNGKVGWAGGFEAMAVKTVLRRLLSKYGYLSVEMQGVLSDDVRHEAEDAPAISEGRQTIDISEAQYENVATGQPASPEQGQAAESENEPY